MPGPGAAPDALAWVESPFQLLGAVEAFAAGVLGARLEIVPRQDSAPLARTVTELRRLGLPYGVQILPPAATPRRRTGGTLAVGDALSGRVQRLVLHTRPDRLVLLDDGRSTRRVMDALLVPQVPLLRPHVERSMHRTLLARVALYRLHALARKGRLGVVTAMDLPEDLVLDAKAAGIDVRRHHFFWLRGLPPDVVPGSNTVVLGTALVANGLVRPEPYIEWVRSLAASGSPVTYWAHRREDARTLGPLARDRRIQVAPGDVPIELRLRGVTTQRLLTLPTTAATTLRMIAPDIDLQEFAVPEDWWQPDVPRGARRHLVPDRSGGPAVEAGTVPLQGRVSPRQAMPLGALPVGSAVDIATAVATTR